MHKSNFIGSLLLSSVLDSTVAALAVAGLAPKLKISSSLSSLLFLPQRSQVQNLCSVIISFRAPYSLITGSTHKFITYHHGHSYSYDSSYNEYYFFHCVFLYNRTQVDQSRRSPLGATHFPVSSSVCGGTYVPAEHTPTLPTLSSTSSLGSGTSSMRHSFGFSGFS